MDRHGHHRRRHRRLQRRGSQPGFSQIESGSSPLRPSVGQRDGHCPVCLQTATFPVTTNCGHLFCAPCLIAYWRYGSWLSAISCPVCRQEVNMLRRLFSESQADRRSKEAAVDITDYNKRYSGAPRRVMDYLRDAPLFLQLLARGLTAVGGLVWLFFLRVVLCCVGAAVSLTSRHPDTVPPSSAGLETDRSVRGLLGALDDLAAVTLLLTCAVSIHRQMAPERGRSASVSATRAVL